MPRDGSGVYSQPLPDVVSATPIASTVYNGFVADIVTDLNAARPVVAGGTGATSAAAAAVALSAELAAYVVTNFDSHVWYPGSFRAATTATNSPVAGHAFAGTVYINEAYAYPPTNQNLVVEARDLDDTDNLTVYVRVKTAGVWGSWNGVAATPLDAMAYNGMQINGGFSISQELGTGGRNTSGYFCDQWQMYAVGTAVVGSYGSAGSTFPGFTNFGQAVVATAQAVLGAGDCYGWLQSIEGYRTSRLAWGTASARPITIGFYCAHHRTGIYSVAVRNSASNRSYVTTYTQNVADAVEYKTLTIPGDTSGTWLTGTGIGLSVLFTMGAGSTYTAATANVWGNGNFFAAPGQVNAVASTADAFKITGVTVMPGSNAPLAINAMLLTRHDIDELRACYRYYYKGLPFIQGECTSAGIGATTPIAAFNWPTPMRVNPTVTSPTFTTIGVGTPTVASPLTQWNVGWQALSTVGVGSRTVFLATSGNLIGDART